MGQAQNGVNRGISNIKAAQIENTQGQVMFQSQCLYSGGQFCKVWGHKADCLEQRSKLQRTGQLNMLLEKPNTSGLQFRRSKSHPPCSDLADFLNNGELLGTVSSSPCSSIIKSFSEPITKTQTGRLKGRLKKLKPKHKSEKLKPKHKSDFVKGSIIRWEEFSASEGKDLLKK